MVEILHYSMKFIQGLVNFFANEQETQDFRCDFCEMLYLSVGPANSQNDFIHSLILEGISFVEDRTN